MTDVHPNVLLVRGLFDRPDANAAPITMEGYLEGGWDTRFAADVTYCGTSATCAYIEPNFKIKVYKNDDEGLTLAAGALLHAPVNQRTGNDTWGLFYGNFSKKVKTGNYGPRLSAGPYVVADKNPATFTAVGAHRVGAILGYEQPLASKVSFVADWYSGKNYYGYFTPGISITLPHNGLLNAGYSIGNDSWANSNATKNRFVFLYYGVTF